jgi:uncharacterized protein
VSAAPIDGEEELRALYHPAGPAVLAKEIPVIDEQAAAFIAQSTFVVIASSGPSGADASPRGGPPGFVRVLDEGRVAFGDLAGNNRLDTYSNLLAHPEVGLLLFIPGMEETLRVNGRAHISTDPAVLGATEVDGRSPKVAVVVEVVGCYLHCAKALRRGGLWNPETWADPADRPSPGTIFASHLKLDVDPALIDADLEAGYQVTIWEHGGR